MLTIFSIKKVLRLCRTLAWWVPFPLPPPSQFQKIVAAPRPDHLARSRPPLLSVTSFLFSDFFKYKDKYIVLLCRRQRIPDGVEVDWKITKTYAKNKASSFKLLKCIYELYDGSGKIGNYAAVVYQWTGDLFPLPGRPHGNSKRKSGEDGYAVCRRRVCRLSGEDGYAAC